MGDSADSVTATAAAHLAVLSQQAAELCYVAELYDVKDGFDRRAADVERLELGCHLMQEQAPSQATLPGSSSHACPGCCLHAAWRAACFAAPTFSLPILSTLSTMTHTGLNASGGTPFCRSTCCMTLRLEICTVQ